MSSDHQHLVLLGDSIFDNGVYVPGGTPVIDHMRSKLPPGCEASLLAVDGNVAVDVARQLQQLPKGATHLAVSVGGNDALGASGLLLGPVNSAEQLMRELSAAQEEFRADYREMLRAVLACGLPALVCTVYDAIPGMPRWQLSGLSLFNDVILREVARQRVPVIDLRQICSERGDYSELSPIEPSTSGGWKIANAIIQAMFTHDFRRRECVIYTG